MLIVESGADPWVVRCEDVHLCCHVVDDASVHVRTSATLEGLGAAETVEVWRPPAHLQTLWAPELHRLDGRWWICVAADDGDAQHRMRVLSADAPTGPYAHEGQITTQDDRWAVDGTVLEHGGARCFVWSGRHRAPGSGGDRQVRIAPCTWGPDGAMVVTPDELVLPAQRTAAAAELPAG